MVKSYHGKRAMVSASAFTEDGTGPVTCFGSTQALVRESFPLVAVTLGAPIGAVMLVTTAPVAPFLAGMKATVSVLFHRGGSALHQRTRRSRGPSVSPVRVGRHRRARRSRATRRASARRVGRGGSRGAPPGEPEGRGARRGDRTQLPIGTRRDHVAGEGAVRLPWVMRLADHFVASHDWSILADLDTDEVQAVLDAAAEIAPERAR